MTRSSLGRRTLLTTLVAGVAALVPTAAWALTATLTIPSLCSAPIAVVAFSTETSHTVTGSTGSGGAGAGRPTIKPIVLTKAIDDCSPLLFRAAFTGQHHPTATLQVTDRTVAGFFTIQLTDVLIVNVKTDFAKAARTAVADDVLTETLTVDAAAFAFTSGGTTVGCNQTTVVCQ